MKTDRRRALAALCNAGRELSWASERQRDNLKSIGLAPQIVERLVDLHRKDEERRRMERSKREEQERQRGEYWRQFRAHRSIAAAQDQEEREEQRKLSLRLLSVGSQGAAVKYGDDAAMMRRLKQVRDHLQKLC